jgi:hypothetical protein
MALRRHVHFKVRRHGHYSLSIDTLFDGSPIQNGRHHAHLRGGGDREKPFGFSSPRYRRTVMITKSKLVLIAALAAVSIASPASAQSFNKGDGTGNALAFAYGPGGTKPAWTVAPQNEQIAVSRAPANEVAARQTGRTSFAAVGRGAIYDYVPGPASSDPSANAPSLSGGGSTGYNQMLLNH